MSAYADRTPIFKVGMRGVRALRAYHRHRVYGLENIPTTGAAVIVSNHSLATYDSWLLGPPVAEERGRGITGLVDRNIAKVPLVRDVFAQFCAIGTPETAARLLSEGKLILTFPGGTREMLRGPKRRYQLDWSGRRGFIRLSLSTGAPIILAACPRADDIFTSYANPLTAAAYELLRVPLPLFRGFGPTIIPRPIKLWHLLCEPILPDVAPDQVTPADVDAHHERVTARMERLMSEALAGPR